MPRHDDDIVPLEAVTWRERVRDRRIRIDDAAEVAASIAVRAIATAVEMDDDTRLRLFLHICNRIREEC
jgi:hypothetical protein